MLLFANRSLYISHFCAGATFKQQSDQPGSWPTCWMTTQILLLQIRSLVMELMLFQRWSEFWRPLLFKTFCHTIELEGLICKFLFITRRIGNITFDWYWYLLNDLNFCDIPVTNWNWYICSYFDDATAFPHMNNDLKAWQFTYLQLIFNLKLINSVKLINYIFGLFWVEWNNLLLMWCTNKTYVSNYKSSTKYNVLYLNKLLWYR